MDRSVESRRELVNPIDLGAAATPELFARALPVILHDDAVDAVIVIYAPPVVTDAGAVARGGRRRGGRGRRAASRSWRASSAGSMLPTSFAATATTRVTIPTFAFPEAAARALGRSAGLSAWRARPVGTVPTFDDVDARRRARA